MQSEEITVLPALYQTSFREAERKEIERQTKEWERKNGKVVTQPIIQTFVAPVFNNQNIKSAKKPKQNTNPNLKPRAVIKSTKKTKVDVMVEFLNDPKNANLTYTEVVEKSRIHKKALTDALKITTYEFRKAVTKKDLVMALADSDLTVLQVSLKVGCTQDYARIVYKNNGINKPLE